MKDSFKSQLITLLWWQCVGVNQSKHKPVSLEPAGHTCSHSSLIFKLGSDGCSNMTTVFNLDWGNYFHILFRISVCCLVPSNVSVMFIYFFCKFLFITLCILKTSVTHWILFSFYFETYRRIRVRNMPFRGPFTAELSSYNDWKRAGTCLPLCTGNMFTY